MKSKENRFSWFPREKKAAEMTIGTIIIIILALVVLAVIIYGFTTGWGNLWQNILNFGGGKINVASVVNACQVACVSSSEYDYCTLTRKVTFNDQGSAYPDNGKSFNCKDLETKGVGISCGNLDCSGAAAGVKTCANQGGGWKTRQCLTDSVNGEVEVLDITNNQGQPSPDAHCCKTTCTSLGGNWYPTICTGTQKKLEPTYTADQTGNFCCK